MNESETRVAELRHAFRVKLNEWERGFINTCDDVGHLNAARALVRLLVMTPIACGYSENDVDRAAYRFDYGMPEVPRINDTKGRKQTRFAKLVSLAMSNYQRIQEDPPLLEWYARYHCMASVIYAKETAKEMLESAGSITPAIIELAGLSVMSHHPGVEGEDPKHDFSLVDGADILEEYDKHLIDGNCMTGKLDYLTIYEQTENVSLAVLKDSHGVLMSRCLIWTAEYYNSVKIWEPCIAIDRIYGRTQKLERAMSRAIVEHFNKATVPVYYRKNQYSLGDAEYDKPIRVMATNESDRFPYMDSMRYMYLDEGDSFYLYSKNVTVAGDYLCILDSTDGNGVDGYQTTCEECCERYDEDDLAYIECVDGRVCGNCLSAHFCYTVDDEYERNENCVEFTGSNGDAHWAREDNINEHATLCVDCDEYHDNDCVTCVGGDDDDEYVCEDCLSSYYHCGECREYKKPTAWDNEHDMCNECSRKVPRECEGCGAVFTQAGSGGSESKCSDCESKEESATLTPLKPCEDCRRLLTWISNGKVLCEACWTKRRALPSRRRMCEDCRGSFTPLTDVEVRCQGCWTKRQVEARPDDAETEHTEREEDRRRDAI